MYEKNVGSFFVKTPVRILNKAFGNKPGSYTYNRVKTVANKNCKWAVYESS